MTLPHSTCRPFCFGSNSICIGDFILKKKIGRGSCSEVFLATPIEGSTLWAYISGRDLVIKKIPKGSAFMDVSHAAYTELLAYERIGRHPNVSIVYASFHDDNANYIAMEHVQGMSLLEYMNRQGPMQEKVALRIVSQILFALAFVHSKGFAHRDVKPENIIIAPSPISWEYHQVKLIDFSHAVVCAGDCALFTSSYGTRIYSAPETLKNKGYSVAKADMWAVGLIMYTMITGKYAFRSKAKEGLNSEILGAPMSLYGGNWINVSFDTIRLVRGLLNCDVESRLSAMQALRWVDETRALKRLEMRKRVTFSHGQQRMADVCSIFSGRVRSDGGEIEQGRVGMEELISMDETDSIESQGDRRCCDGVCGMRCCFSFLVNRK